MKAKEFRMFTINRICPKCGSGNWMRGMEGPNVGDLDVKCLNCLSYFKSAELYSDIKPAKLSINCIVCDKEIELEDGQSDIIPRLCDECKEAVKFAKELKSRSI